MITQERLKQQLHYDEESGLFTYTSNRGKCHKGARAGTWHEYGYRQIQLDGKIYKEHRLAWLYVYGYMPEEIDHINGQRDCNPIAISGKFLVRRITRMRKGRLDRQDSAELPGLSAIRNGKRRSRLAAKRYTSGIMTPPKPPMRPISSLPILPMVNMPTTTGLKELYHGDYRKHGTNLCRLGQKVRNG